MFRIDENFLIASFLGKCKRILGFEKAVHKDVDAHCQQRVGAETSIPVKRIKQTPAVALVLLKSRIFKIHWKMRYVVSCCKCKGFMAIC